jgi:hypothetical protein
MPAVVSGFTVTERPYGRAMSKGALWVLRSSIDPPGRTTHQWQQVIRKAPWLSPGGFPSAILIGSGDELQVLSRTLAPLALYEFVLDALTLVEGAEPRCFDRRDVDESVRSAALRLNEAIALRGVEPLHGSGWQGK